VICRRFRIIVPTPEHGAGKLNISEQVCITGTPNEFLTVFAGTGIQMINIRRAVV
jgi:hypothetical protein|tara:strand:- start:29929 stop:30093 length:165 start_codon:yes stop_codon:yes gene_type:complete